MVRPALPQNDAVTVGNALVEGSDPVVIEHFAVAQVDDRRGGAFQTQPGMGEDIPLGSNRTYARVTVTPNYDSWLEAVKAGRGFVTNSPIVEFDVSGSKPGDVIEFEGSKTVKARATVRSILPINTVDIVMNGRTVGHKTVPLHHRTPPADGIYTLEVEATVEGGEVKATRCSGTLFRGFEKFLQGRDPYDAQHLVQRICGVCPTSHAMTATLNLDSAFGIADLIPENGRIIRNLIQGANFIQSHILHFYHLAALDYVDVTKVADYEGSDPSLVSVKNFISQAVEADDMSLLGPFYPRYEGDYRLSTEANQAAVAHYIQALNIRRISHEMSAIFSGKMPHNVAIVPGGATELPTVQKIADFLWRLQEIRQFIDNIYIPDIIAVAEAFP